MASICDTLYILSLGRTHHQVWLQQLTMTNLAVCHDRVVKQHFAACSGSPHDDESSH